MAETRSPVDGGCVLLTGASAGIGRGLASLLAARAATLVLIARRAEEGCSTSGRGPA